MSLVLLNGALYLLKVSHCPMHTVMLLQGLFAIV